MMVCVANFLQGLDAMMYKEGEEIMSVMKENLRIKGLLTTI